MIYVLLAGTCWAAFDLTRRRGGRPGLWACWPPALMLLPVWLGSGVGALRLDLRTAAATGALLGGLARTGPGPRDRWLLSDSLIAALVGAQVVSEYRVGLFGTFTVPEVLRSWLLPYWLGRRFLASTEDLEAALSPFARASLALSLFAAFEAVTKFHPINRALGKTYGLLEQGEGYRMGLKRAQGMTDHPIFLGMLLVLFLPWAMEAARLAGRGRGPSWWRALPWLSGGAVLVTVSRGPYLAAAVALYVAAFFSRRRWRIPLAGLAILGAVGAVAHREVVFDSFQKAAGEGEEGARVIVIDGEPEVYTGTRHRVLLYKVYADAIRDAGLFGHGLQMKGIELEEELADRFGSIDSHYLMFYLQRGYSGVVPFVLLALCTLGQLARMAWPAAGPRAHLAGSLFGAMAALDVGLFSVWFAPDLGAVWLFNAGLAANLAVLPAISPVPIASAVRAPARRAPRPARPLAPNPPRTEVRP